MADCSSTVWHYLFREVSLASKLFALVEGTLPEDDPYLRICKLEGDQANKVVKVEVLYQSKRLEMHVTKGSAIGDNYMSIVYNLRVVVPDLETYHAFAKVAPVNWFLRTVATNSGVYERENYMYCVVFPALRMLLAEYGLKPCRYLQVPQLYFSQLNNPAYNNRPNTVLVLEDMSRKGFTMADKLRGCDMAHVTLTLSNLAHFHALSIAYTRRSINLIPSKQAGLVQSFQQDQEFLRTVLQNMTLFMRLLGQEPAAKRIERIIPEAQSIVANEDIADCGPLGCIIHGDFWINNILFSYDSHGRPHQVTFVDWQISRSGHPAWDIIYFLIVSTTSQLRRENLDSLLHDYFATLNAALGQLGIQLSEENYFEKDFRSDFHRRLLKGTITGCIVLPFLLNQGFAGTVTRADEDENTASPADEMDTDRKAFLQARDAALKTVYSPEKLYDAPLIRQRLSELILEMEERCVL